MTVYRSKSKVGVGFAIYQDSGNDNPLTSPISHLSEIKFHSAFSYYQAAPGFPQDVPVSHLAVAADPGTVVFSAGAVSVVAYTSVTDRDIVVATHNLGYKPNFMVSLGGVQYPAGCPIQIGANGARRCITFWVDATNIYVRDSARPSIPGLPAISVTYHVTVYRDPGPIGNKLEEVPTNGNPIRLGYGAIDTGEHMAREPDTGETTYFIPAGETMDLKNGRIRFALPDGSMFDVGPLSGIKAYNGIFTGGPSKGIAI